MVIIKKNLNGDTAYADAYDDVDNGTVRTTIGKRWVDWYARMLLWSDHSRGRHLRHVIGRLV